MKRRKPFNTWTQPDKYKESIKVLRNSFWCMPSLVQPHTPGFPLNPARSTKWPQMASTCRSMEAAVKTHDPLLSPSFSSTQRRCEPAPQRRCGDSLTTAGLAGAIGAWRQTETCLHARTCTHKHAHKPGSARLTLRLVSWEVKQESHDHL